MRIDRRTLLVGTGAGIGLAVAYAWWPRGDAAVLRPRESERLLGPGIAIAPDGKVTIAVPQVETGQGIWTGLAQEAADELGAAWDRVAVAAALPSPLWDNGFAQGEGWTDALGPWRRWQLDEGAMRITAGSTSIRAMAPVMRRLGAAARALLTAEAASRWGVAAAECDATGGFVTHEGKRLAFAELAEGAAARQLPDTAPLRPRVRALGGQPLPRLDSAPKATGSLRFAGDVRLPGMLFASLRLSSGGAARVESPAPVGVEFVTGSGWVVAIAPDWWSAENALAKASVRTFGQGGGDDAAIEAALDAALAGEEIETLFAQGDVEQAFEGARPLAATYSAAAMLHHDLEPPSATARLANGLLEVWAGTQAPELVRRRLAASGSEQVILYPMPVGGQGGRALDDELATIAVTLARRMGKPVQVTLSRTEQVRSDPVRSPLKARLLARPMPDGSIAGWRMRLAGVDGTGAAMARLLGVEAGAPRSALLPSLPYGVPNVAVEFAAASLPLRTGYHRGELLGPLTFFTESFLDELARIGGRDPLGLRIGLLGGNPRLARCLVRATALGGWDGGGAGSQMGLAVASVLGSHIALVASASLGPGGIVAPDRLVAVVDCGRVVNPALVRQQVEGGLIAALAQASAPAPRFRHGRVLEPLQPQAPTMAAHPEMLVEILASGADPGGVNGLASAVAPAAVGNALAAATGRRLRSLPFAPMA